jgi:hypothetical protein
MHARRCRAIDTRLHTNPSIRACARVWLQPNADGAADARVRVCASGHPYTPRCTSVDADAHLYRRPYHAPARAHTHTHTFTHTWIRYMHSYLYICAHTYTYVCKSCGRARPRRSRRALTRTYAHAHTRRHVLHICSLTYTHGLRHTHIYMYIVTHS